MAQLVPQFLCRVRIFLIRYERPEELLDLLLVNKTLCLIRGKEFIEIERIIDTLVLPREVNPARRFLSDHRRETIGIHRHARQTFVRIVFLALPCLLCRLLVRIRPVKNLRRRELIARERLERRPRKIERILTVNKLKRPIRAEGIDALLRLIHNEKVKRQIADPFELIMFPAKINRAFDPLQGFKRHHTRGRIVLIIETIHILCAREYAGLSRERRRVRDKEVMIAPSEKRAKIIRPRACNTRTIRHDKDVCQLHAANEVIGSQRLAKARFRIPQEFTAAAVEIRRRHPYRLRLLGAQRIVAAFRSDRLFARGKAVEVELQGVSVRVKPLRPRLALHINLFEVVVEMTIRKIFARAVLEYCVVRPRDFPSDICRMRLLCDALHDGLPLRIADLRPAVMIGNPRRIVGVDHRHNAPETLNLHRHHTISFTCDSINAISSCVSPYFA